MGTFSGEAIQLRKPDGSRLEGQLVALLLNSRVTRRRDGAWTSELNSHQIVELHYPKTKGARIKVMSTNEDQLSVSIGYVENYDVDRDYKCGLLRNLSEESVDYANGNSKRKLKDVQQIFLIEDYNAIEAISLAPNSVIKRSAVADKPMGSVDSCLYGIGAMGFLFVILWLISMLIF